MFRLRDLSRVSFLAALLWICGGVRADFETETLATGLNHPWALAFLPDGDFLVTERAGHLRRVSPDGVVSAPIEGLPEIFVKSQGGLMDVLLAPDFSESRQVYLSYSIGSAEANATRLARARLTDQGLIDFEVLFTAEPMRDRPVHYGGRMAFLPDGTLLLTLGDGFDLREQAQQLDSHTGSIVRLRADGRPAEDNPFTDRPDARPEIFSYGHRNPQGLIVDTMAGAIWSHEHGPRGGDELNRIEAGVNYGWPIATQGIDYSGARISPFETWPEARDPIWVWTPSIAPAGMAQYRGAIFSDWDGDLLIASLAERSLRRLDLEGGQVVDDEKIPLDIDERLRDVRVGPTGEIYLLTDSPEGRILRLRPPAG